MQYHKKRYIKVAGPLVCAVQGHPLPPVTGWQPIIGCARRPTLANRHSLTAWGKTGKMAQTQNQGEVQTFATIASLSLKQLTTPNCRPAGERGPDLFRNKSEKCVGIPIAPDNMIYWILLPGVSRRGRGEIKTGIFMNIAMSSSGHEIKVL